MIEVRNLSKYFGAHPAVVDVSFRAEKGEIVGFLGPNGAGKTTTMRMLTCFLPPTSGTASICGFDILDQSLDVRRKIGYLPENVPLYLDLKVNAYLDFVGTLKEMTARDRKRRISAVIEECGLEEVYTRPIGKLSRGYRQRVGLAQALINDPEVLILDEPTVGLDPRQIVEIRELIRGLAGERTIVLSTHILPEVSLLCQRVIIINRGRLITDDTPENLGQHLSGADGVNLIVRGNGPDVVEAIATLDGVNKAEIISDEGDGTIQIRVETDPESDVREAIAARVIESGFGLVELSARSATLEDVFVHLVAGEGPADG